MAFPEALGISCRFALIALLSGCGVEVEPIEVAEGCPQEPLRGPSHYADAPRERLIDDFEHESNFLPRVQGRNGVWVFGTDETSDEVRAEVSDHCAARGERAGHFAGSGFSGWGANWTALLRDQPDGTAVPYDGSAYGGFSFFAAASPGTAAPYVLPVGLTTVAVAWNGEVCTACMDFHRAEVSLEHHWQRYEVRFDDLAQRGFGDPLVELRQDELVGVIFWPEDDFDLWVDDLRFEQ